MKTELKLQTFIFEIRYAFGHLYVDRCGQTLLDIEKMDNGWIAGTPDINSGVLEKPEKSLKISFTSNRSNFTTSKAFQNDIFSYIEEIKELWKIVKANLGLEEFTRIGYRLEYLLPVTSLDEAEAKLKNSKLNVLVPKPITSNYKVEKRNIIIYLSRKEIEYRIQLQCITQAEAIDPSNLIKGNPRAMHKRQQKIRIAQLKQLEDYSANPMYAVMLDVDCVEYQPKTVNIEKYISEQTKIVENDFLSLLKGL